MRRSGGSCGETDDEIQQAIQLQEECRKARGASERSKESGDLNIDLDANIIISLVENHPVWAPRALAKVRQFTAVGDQITTGDVSRLECLVGPYLLSDSTILADYQAFFQAPGMRMLPVTAAVCERAALLRATFKIKPLDALPLATAIEHGCGRFLTNDAPLRKCTQIHVEILDMTSLLQSIPSPMKIREELERMVLKDLLGPVGGAEEEIDEPSVRDRYLVGMLAPKRQELSPEEFDELPQGGSGSVEDGADREHVARHQDDVPVVVRDDLLRRPRREGAPDHRPLGPLSPGPQRRP